MELDDIIVSKTEIKIGDKVCIFYPPTLKEWSAFTKWCRKQIKSEFPDETPVVPINVAYHKSLEVDGLWEMTYLIINAVADNPKIPRDDIKLLSLQDLSPVLDIIHLSMSVKTPSDEQQNDKLKN